MKTVASLDLSSTPTVVDHLEHQTSTPPDGRYTYGSCQGMLPCVGNSFGTHEIRAHHYLSRKPPDSADIEAHRDRARPGQHDQRFLQTTLAEVSRAESAANRPRSDLAPASCSRAETTVAPTTSGKVDDRELVDDLAGLEQAGAGTASEFEGEPDTRIVVGGKKSPP